MKRMVVAGVLALAAVAATGSPASAFGGGGLANGFQFSAGLNVTVGGHFRFGPAPCPMTPGMYAGGGGGYAPWYSYWPLDAHFQSPAPFYGAGYGQSYMAPYSSAAAQQYQQYYAAPQMTTPAPAAPTTAAPGVPAYTASYPGHYPMSYTVPTYQAPAYWYGR